MLSKEKRLTRQQCEGLLKRRSNILHSPSLFVRYVPASDFKVAVAVSKKVSKLAVDRNRIRRSVYDAFASFVDTPVHILVSTKKQIRDKSRGEIAGEVTGIIEEVKRRIS